MPHLVQILVTPYTFSVVTKFSQVVEEATKEYKSKILLLCY